MVSWMANVAEGEFALFGATNPIVSKEVLASASLIQKIRLAGVQSQNLYRYAVMLDVLAYPYVGVLPAKAQYEEKDILPALNVTLVAYERPAEKEISTALPREDLTNRPSEGGASSSAPQGEGMPALALKGSVFQERAMLSWFSPGRETETFVVYRLTMVPQKSVIRGTTPLARVTGTSYEDTPPVGGPYYYVVMRDTGEGDQSYAFIGPLWFPREPSSPQVIKEE